MLLAWEARGAVMLSDAALRDLRHLCFLQSAEPSDGRRAVAEVADALPAGRQLGLPAAHYTIDIVLF